MQAGCSGSAPSEVGVSQPSEQQSGQGWRAGGRHCAPQSPTAHSATTRRTSPGLRVAHPEGDLIYLNNHPRKQEGSGKRRPIVWMGTLRLREAVTQPLPGAWHVRGGAGAKGEAAVLGRGGRSVTPAQPQAPRQRSSPSDSRGPLLLMRWLRRGQVGEKSPLC